MLWPSFRLILSLSMHARHMCIRVSAWWRCICVILACPAPQALGISVEFCAHVVHAFVVAPGTRQERMATAVADVGASVLSGITLTKLVGE